MIPVRPDGLFALTFPDDTVAYFLLEIDRGTIPCEWRSETMQDMATMGR